jgi:cytochrome P450
MAGSEMISTLPSLLDQLGQTEDVYGLYATLREEAPVTYVEADDVWVVTRYQDVADVLRTPEIFSSTSGMGRLMAGQLGPSTLGKPDPALFGVDIADLRVLIASDPPVHTRLRRMVSQAFTPRVVAELEGRVQAICDTLVDGALAKADDGSTVDLIADIAWPLPVIVIAELLGVPPERRHEFKRWSDCLVGGLTGTLAAGEAMNAAMELHACIGEFVESRSRRPADDLISRLVTVGGKGEEPLSPVEVTMFCVLLLVAGNETTTNLIGNGAAALVANPDQALRLRNDPSLVPGAIEEVVRFDGPVQALFRGTQQAVELGGIRIPEGATVMPLLGAANRDPRQFVEPDRFQITRKSHNHLGFGSGIHLCIGAPLARLEARVVATTLLRRVATVAPEEPPTRQLGYLLRGFSHFPVTVTRGDC